MYKNALNTIYFLHVQKIVVGILVCSFLFSNLGTLFSLPAIQKTDAAETTIDSSAQVAGTSHTHAGTQTVFTSDQVGYKFYRDGSGECVYAKTTDAGATWGSAVIVDDQGTGTDCVSISVWYDRWTPNDTGNIIHIATLDTSTDDIYYNNLDTTTDTRLTGSTAIDTNNGNVQAPTIALGANYQSITKGTDGTIYVTVSDTSDSYVLDCSANCNLTTSWSETGTNPLDLANDYSLLVPLVNGDIMLINRDISLKDIRSKIWHKAAATWDASWTFIDTNATNNATYDVGLAATVASSTSAATSSVYLAYTADNATLGTDDDIRTALYEGGHWSNTSDVLTNDTKGLTSVAISRDTNTGDIYVGYSGRTTATTTTTGNVYWKKSSDKMSTWGSENGPVNSAADDIYGVDLNLASNQRIYESWFAVSTATISGDTIADLIPGVIVTSSGSQITNISAPATNTYIGGKFVVNEYVSSRDVTSVVLSENGTVDASNALKNIKLYYENDTSAPYDCASESYSGTESQFGSTDTNGFSGADGTAAFSGTSAYVATSSALCLYVVADINNSAVNADTLNVYIANPSTDLSVTGGGEISPATQVDITGSTTIYNDAPTQTHFHWRYDNGSETTATSHTFGVEDTNLSSMQPGVTTRLRIGVANLGGTSTPPMQYRLEYSLATTSCNLATGWTDVGASTDAIDMSPTANLTDGNDTTNIAVANGGVTDTNTTFLTPNGGVKDTTSQTSAIVLSPSNYTDLEYAIVASTSAPSGSTYCFRVTDAGTPLTAYSVYPRATVNSDVSITATSSQIATTTIPSSNVYVGGAYVITENTASRNVTSITLTENGTVDGSTGVSNVKLLYDLDTTAPYDCASESYSGTESQFGSTDTNGFSGPNGTSTFTDSVAISTTSTLCIYPVMDITSSAVSGQTLNVVMQDPATDVVVSGGGSVGPTVKRDIASSTLLEGAVLTQSHYHWRNDNGSEATATSQTSGIEDTPVTDISQKTPVRLRLEVSNEGVVSSPSTALRLEYGTKITSCSAVGAWTQVGTTGAAWNMYNSPNITDGSNTTNISTTTGGVTDENTVFLTSNSALKDTSSQIATTTFTSSDFLEAEFSLKQASSSAYNTTYCFRVTNAGTPLNAYSTYPELTTSPQRDFEIQRGTATIGTGVTSVTLVAGVDYIAPASTSSAFIRITNTDSTGAGSTAGGNQTANNVTTYITNPQNLLTSVTIARAGTTADTRVSWEIVEFIGKPGSDNEMIVRDQRSVSYLSAGLVATGTAVANVSNNASVVVFITGQGNNSTARTLYNAGQSTSAWNSTSQQPVFTRAASGAVVNVSYAVVEFVGPNWKVQRVEHTYTAAGITETENITAVNSLTRTFMHTQKRVGTGLDLLNEFGHEVWMSSIGVVSFFLEPAAASPNLQTSVVWIIENTQTTTGSMVVTRSSGSNSSATIPSIFPVSIGTTLDDLTNASIFTNERTVGASTAFPRAMAGITITSSTTYEIWRGAAAGVMTYRTEVVQWPTAGLAFKQKDYRFYDDNNALNPTDPWPAGPSDLGEDTVLTASDKPLGDGKHIRVRMSLEVLNATFPALSESFKLQYGERVTTCSAISESNWYDVGSTTSSSIWRGYHASGITDGTALSSNPPSGGDLDLSLSNLAGTYSEQNNTPVNPYAGDAGNVVEYDWNIEQNGATPETFYCLRMVKADGTALGGYTNYPQLSTSSFTPKTQNWRWYSDATSETPTIAYGAENVAPINIANTNALKLRVTVKETENIARDDVRFKLQYSEYPDFSKNVYDVVATSSCTASSTWCYFDGGGSDNAVISTGALSDSDSCIAGVGNGCGTHNESPTYLTGFRQQNSAATEYDFSLKASDVRTNAVYYFRLYSLAQSTPVVTNGSSSYPSLVTEGAQLVFNVTGLPAGTTTEGVTTNGSSTATTVKFGTVPFDTPYTVGYRLHVNTDATQGYQIFMYADQQLLNAYGTPIAPITGSNASPVDWATGCSSSATGCFGYHPGDDSLSAGSARFAPNDTYAPLSTTPQEVMYSSVPIDDTHDIVFKMLVREGQPAGDYQTNVSYLAIPVF